MRRLVIILGLGAAGALIALAALPWWLSPVLRRVGHRWGADFARYERVGYARFALRDVVVTRSNVVVRVDRAETETPLLWAWHHWAGRPAAISASAWRVEVAKPSESSARAPGKGGAMHLRSVLFKVASALDRWVPQAEIGAGVVIWPGGELQIGSGQWKQRSLTVHPLRHGTREAEVQVTFAKNDELQLKAGPVDDAPWQLTLTSVGEEITGQLQAWDQRAPITARLPEQGWMPAALDVRAEHWSIPATQLKLGESYAMVRGEARLAWREARLEIFADLSGEVAQGKKAPPLSAKLHAKGDTESLAVDVFSIQIPGVSAALSDPFVLSRKGGASTSASHFTLEVDLQKQPWLPAAKGRISGRAEVAAAKDGWPKIDAMFNARELAVGDWSMARFTTALALDWPRLEVKQTVLSFAEGGQLAARGAWDFQTSEVIDAVVDGTLRPSAVAHWLPAGVGFESLTLAAKAHGPLAALQHEGSAKVAAFTAQKINPLAISVAWKGTGRKVEISEGSAQAGSSRIGFAGTLDEKGARIEALKLVQGGDERLALSQPAGLQWSPKIEVGSLELKGGDASVAVAGVGGESGRFMIAARNFPSGWLTDFVAVPGPDWRLTSLEARGKWDRSSPMVFSIRSELAVTLAPERFAAVTLAAQGGGEGIKIDSLTIAEGTSPIVNVTGQLPVSLHPGAAVFMRIEKEAPLALHALTATNPAFWKTLTETTGLEFQEPELKAELAGTWSQPKGEVTAKAARVAADPARIKFSFPTVEGLDVHAVADSQGLAVDRLFLWVEGQEVRASGKLPLTSGQWADFKHAPLAYLRREGNLRLEIPDAEIAAFARYTSAHLAPAGRLQVDVTIKPGGEMTGALRVQNAVTRPLGPLGVLQEVQVEAQLAGRTIELKNVSAQAGRQPVTLSGKIQLPPDAAPKYDLSLKGENLPLVRRTGLLLRADLDLKLVTQRDDVTTVSGAVRLRDSMFLSDVRALIPRGGRGGPAARPPFFSLEIPPFNAWRLGVDVRGEKFMRLRSTAFVGVASARFRLSGTLGDPRATGEATVDSGKVLLPFASFNVEQGSVRLTEADPYALSLFLSGTSRRYGYDLRMELTGTAAEPVVTFSSSPPLDAKQVLLMVTAGETPRDEVTYGASQRVARFGTYLGQSLINNFGGDSTDADRLSISTGDRVSRQGRETYDIEYRLTERLTLIGEYDEFDDYNAGVKWRLFEPRKKTEKVAESTKPTQKKEAPDAPAP